MGCAGRQAGRPDGDAQKDRQAGLMGDERGRLASVDRRCGGLLVAERGKARQGGNTGGQ